MDLADVIRRLADTYSSHGQHEKALQEYKEEAEIYKTLKRNLDYAQSIRRVGETYLYLDSHESALKYTREYLSVAREIDNKLEMQRAYTTLGRCYLNNYITQSLACDGKSREEDLGLAEKNFRKSLNMTEE